MLLLIAVFTSWISVMLVAVLLFLGFKILESGWSHPIRKPWSWEDDIKKGIVPLALKKAEKRYPDKIRLYTFWFQVRRLNRDQIAGAFAELGVYKGESARLLHAMDSTRKFYLFDTFEGFSKADLAKEKLAPENEPLDFSNTSVELVRDLIHGNENVIFRPGYFPLTAHDLDEIFALVHLDADLYEPTIAALNYFYPRMAEGGVIIIHDYNHSWGGIPKALDEFMSGIPETLVEVADWQGTAMIVRNRR